MCLQGLVQPPIKPNLSNGKPKGLRYCMGMGLASFFSLIYFVAPIYMGSVVILGFWSRFSSKAWWTFASPMIVSALFCPVALPGLVKRFRAIFDYFEYEEIIEQSPVDVKKEILENKKNYLVVCQPHGTLSYAGIALAVNAGPEWKGLFHTAVADAVLYTPILKHVLGIFGLISASKKSIRKRLQKPSNCVVLYVGGLAELFLSCRNRERIYLMKRKGFIKLALQEGVDIVPVYLFGNTSVLSVWHTGLLASISRRFQVSLTYIWGKWGLPIPRDCKLLYASGQPLGLPRIENPTQADIDRWHAKYCKEVVRIFDKYKERVPEYKHKQLEIV